MASLEIELAEPSPEPPPADVERERLYELLRERERLLDGVVENAPIGMAVTALYGKVLRANRALREITGLGDCRAGSAHIP